MLEVECHVQLPFQAEQGPPLYLGILPLEPEFTQVITLTLHCIEILCLFTSISIASAHTSAAIIATSILTIALRHALCHPQLHH